VLGRAGLGALLALETITDTANATSRNPGPAELSHHRRRLRDAAMTGADPAAHPDPGPLGTKHRALAPAHPRPGKRLPRVHDDLFNLVTDPAVPVVAWARVRGHRGKRSAGVDRVKPESIFAAAECFLPALREDLKARLFTPMPVRERMIPKPGSTKRWRLGIPTACENRASSR